jgi:hypothetical protein
VLFILSSSSSGLGDVVVVGCELLDWARWRQRRRRRWEERRWFTAATVLLRFVSGFRAEEQSGTPIDAGLDLLMPAVEKLTVEM